MSLIQVITHSLTHPFPHSLAYSFTVDGMETCFEFDTSKSGPVSYDMEVSTADPAEIEGKSMYLKKTKRDDICVLGVPSGTHSLTHSLTYLLTHSLMN